MNTISPATLRRAKPLLQAVAAAIVMGIGTYWLLQWLTRVPGWLGPVQLPLAVILVLGGGVFLISLVREATTGIDAAWSRTLPYVAPALVLVVIGLVWADRRAEPARAEALEQPIAATSVSPAPDDSQPNDEPPYAPPVSPVPASELAEPKPGEPLDR